jgi:membrane carboxypeptidase/penicillin-binding protein
MIQKIKYRINFFKKISPYTIGIKKYQSLIQSFGISTEEYFHEAHSIGSFNGSNALKMAAAYAVFANGGYYYEPYSVNKIIYRE